MIQYEQDDTKHYGVGYVSGAFDLFHVGHLNLIRRAKEKCDYLIVGVTIDEIIEEYKGRRPIIPLEQRLEIVRAIKYVDETVIVDYHNMDKLLAHDLYKYDVHFSGDDHAGEWYELQTELRRRGSDIYFFDYTQGVSSSQIKREITYSNV